MKKLTAVLLTTAMVAAMGTGFTVTANAAAKTTEEAEVKTTEEADAKKTEEADAKTTEEAADTATAGAKVEWDVEPQFEPNKDYEVYTVVEYTIEDLNADLVCTVCKKGEKEYEILTNFYGDDQDVVCEYDGKDLKIITDKTGFMEGDTPAILDKAIEQDKWANIADDTLADGKKADKGDAKAGEKADASALPAEPQFEPNKDYEEYTVVEYTIEDLNADLVCTVCKKGEKEYEILTNFYGDDQDVVCEYDGKDLKIITDKTGFMEGDTPAILDKAIEQNIWVPIA